MKLRGIKSSNRYVSVVVGKDNPNISRVKVFLLSAVLISSMLAVLSPISVSAQGATLYVGCGGPGNYTVIQYAIDNASVGDTVNVCAGTYYENVVMDKPISLSGEGSSSTIIDGGGSGDVVKITSDNVDIRGFSLTGSGVPLDAGLELYYVDNCSIEDNKIFNNSKGIHVIVSNSNNISNNEVVENFDYGLYITASDMNEIFQNELSSNKNGVFLNSDFNSIVENQFVNNEGNSIHTTFSTQNEILDNTFISGRTGLYFYGDSENTISGNVFSGHTGSSILMHESTYMSYSGNQVVNGGISLFGNDLAEWNSHTIDASNTLDGKPIIYLKNQDGGTVSPDAGQIILGNCTNIIVDGNELSNTTTAIHLGFSSEITIRGSILTNIRYYGIFSEYSNNVTIENNTMNENGYSGIYTMYSNDFAMTGNTIIGGEDGITLRGSNNNLIRNNRIIKSLNKNVYLNPSFLSTGNQIYHNDFLGTLTHANDGFTNQWDNGYPSGGNFWGYYPGLDFYNGPAQDVPGPDGLGDTFFPILSGNNQDNYPLIDSVNGPLDFSNEAPMITTEAKTIAPERVPYSVDFEATDVDNDSLVWGLRTNASWLAIDYETGVLSGLPGNSDIGQYWVNVTVLDGMGERCSSHFTLDIHSFSWVDELVDSSKIFSMESITIDDGEASIIPPDLVPFITEDFNGTELGPHWNETYFYWEMGGLLNISNSYANLYIDAYDVMSDRALATVNSAIPVPSVIEFRQRGEVLYHRFSHRISIHDQATLDNWDGISGLKVYHQGPPAMLSGDTWLVDGAFHDIRIEVNVDSIAWYKDGVATPYKTTTGVNLSAGFMLSFDVACDYGGGYIQTWLDYVNIYQPLPEYTGHLLSEEIILPQDGIWDAVYLNKTVPAGSSLSVSVLDAATQAPIPGFESLDATTIDISGLSPALYPSIMLGGYFRTTDRDAIPSLDFWAVDWEVVPGAVPLAQGENFIAISKVQADTSIESVLSSISGKYEKVMWYDASDPADPWKDYTTYKPAWMNDLTNIDHTMGLMVNIIEPTGTVFSPSGDDPTDAGNDIQLHTGWNLVGFPSLTDKGRDAGLNNLAIGVQVDGAYGYDSGNWVELTALDNFEVGKAYWIHASQDCVWDVPL